MSFVIALISWPFGWDYPFYNGCVFGLCIVLATGFVEYLLDDAR